MLIRKDPLIVGATVLLGCSMVISITMMATLEVICGLCLSCVHLSLAKETLIYFLFIYLLMIYVHREDTLPVILLSY